MRHGLAANSFARRDEITFGAGANERALTEETEELFTELVGRLLDARHPHGSMKDPLYRLQPERWLESVLRQELLEIEPGIVPGCVYSQVPAFAAGDRGMLDLLTVDRSGRLLVIELKADEDLHLPLQGLDYWPRGKRKAAGATTARKQAGWDARSASAWIFSGRRAGGIFAAAAAFCCAFGLAGIHLRRMRRVLSVSVSGGGVDADCPGRALAGAA